MPPFINNLVIKFPLVSFKYLDRAKKRKYYICMVNSNDIKQYLGKNIKRLRLAKNLSQEQLAEIVNLERETISAIEIGRAFTSSEVLAEFANYFNVEASSLLKPDFIHNTDKVNDLKKDINHLLSDCNDKKLRTIYNIIIALSE